MITTLLNFYQLSTFIFVLSLHIGNRLEIRQMTGVGSQDSAGHFHIIKLV